MASQSEKSLRRPKLLSSSALQDKTLFKNLIGDELNRFINQIVNYHNCF